jgi:hypothetical protein
LFELEDKIGIDQGTRRDSAKKQAEIMKQIRMREASVLAVAQKVATRLDQTIQHVERIVRH